ncbi:MAG TPA: diguanylate cyclase [Frankiaceae bacterium]|nr:diguanylate cyclase [Frankiaceae bacterium]
MRSPSGEVKECAKGSDTTPVTADRSTDRQRDEALRALLDNRHALFAALSDDGFRIALPPEIGVSEQQVIALPTDRATIIDVLAPAEAMKVVTAWESAEDAGMAFAEVHARHEPERLLTLTMIDMRHRFGVWITTLSPAETTVAPARFADDLAGALSSSVRPRTATMSKSEHAVILDIDDRASRMLGWTTGQMAGKRSTEFLHPDDHERAIAAWLDLLAKKGSQRVRSRHRCADGTWLWIETEHTYLEPEDENSKPSVLAELTDISDEMKAHEDLRRRERLFRRLAESLPLGVLQIDADRGLLYVNERLARIVGSDAPPTLDELVAAVDAGSRPDFDAALDAALHGGLDGELEMTLHSVADGELRILSVNVISLGQGEGVPGALCCFTDITESARLRDELRTKASFDMLTGCHNRATVMAYLSDHLAAGARAAAIFVDLDNFKPINDEFGHEAGDELLVHIAQRLQGIGDSRGMTGRLGGDEFLIVVTGLGSESEAVAFADAVGALVREPVALSGMTVIPSASVGVALSRPGEDARSLIKRADAAMYLAKARGRQQREAAPRT